MAKQKTREKSKAASQQVDPAKSWREAVESIVIAIVLAFLFRAFEAEAFVIPTGSMAPTLQGRHKDVTCPECGYDYQTGASLDAEYQWGRVEAVTCPMCFYTQEMNPSDPADFSHTGDRILVNKFAYEPPFGEPERFDVIVFKYPGNAKQNYIKRLIGVQNETIKIEHGDIFIKPTDGSKAPRDAAFRIARKSPSKLKHMLQLVNDTRYRARALQERDWPLQWQAPGPSGRWTSNDQGETYEGRAADETEWLHFRQYHLNFRSWQMLADLPSGSIEPQVVPITDFYAYNAQSRRQGPQSLRFQHPETLGLHWVGDLAIEAEMEVLSDQGRLSFDLIEAGRHHLCEFDLATGQVTLTIDQGQFPFQDEEGSTAAQVTAETRVKGKGRYRVRFANVDNQLVLWVNDRLCEFTHATTYGPTPNDRPVVTESDPGDLHPVRIGVQGAEVRCERLRVLRDIYYIATDSQMSGSTPADYGYGSEQLYYQHLLTPGSWRPGDLFDRRRAVVFSLQADQFFALGDNSPYSRDSRLWGAEYYVERDLLIGKAVLIYWPHAWRVGIPGTGVSLPLIPNFRKMGLIH